MTDEHSGLNAIDGGHSSIPVWVGVVAILSAFLMITGAVIAIVRPEMLVAPGNEINAATRVYAGYFVARNLLLGLMLPLLLAWRAARSLGNLLTLVGMIQLFDVFMDCLEGRWAIIPGIIVLGVLYLFAGARLSGGPFWRRQVWS